MLESTAIRRLEELVEEWSTKNPKLVAEGDMVVWSVGDYALDLRDLLVVMAAAKGSDKDDIFGHLRYLELGENAVKGWRAANLRQGENITRMRENRDNTLKLIHDAPDIPADTKTKLREALE